MILDRVSGSIDIVTLGALVYVAGYFFEYQAAVAVGLVIGVLGVVKVAYDHLTGFEDPLGIEAWAENEGDAE